MRSPWQVVREWSLVSEEEKSIRAIVDQTGGRGGVNIPFHDVFSVPEGHQREELRHRNEMRRVAVANLLRGVYAQRYDLNDMGASVSFVPKVVFERSVSSKTLSDARERMGVYDANALVDAGYKSGDLPGHRFREMNYAEFNGAPDENVWAAEDAKAAERKAMRDEAIKRKRAAKAAVEPGTLFDASGEVIKP